MVDDLMENKIYLDLEKVAVDSSVWQALRRDCHRAAEGLDH